MKRKAIAIVALLHPAPIAFVLVAATGFTAAAYHFAPGTPPVERLAPFLLAILLTQLAISLHNDYCDRALDAETKPWRALPSGAVSPGAALVLATVLFTAGLASAMSLGMTVVALVALGTVAGFVYNAKLKRTSWSWLPFWIALPTLPICAFAAAGHSTSRLWLVYVIGAPLVLAIHLADTIDDIPSDERQRIRGIAHVLGPRKARFVCWLSLLAAQLLALLFWPAARPGLLFYVSIALLGVAVVTGCAAWAQRGHWPSILGSATALALAWIGGLAS